MSLFDTIHVFLVEDDQLIIDLVQEIFNKKPFGWTSKYTLKSAKNLMDARKYVSGGAWDVVILDLNLPDSKGLKTFQAIYEVAKAPIIVMTGAFDYTLKSQVMGLGARRCVSKLRVAGDLELLLDQIDNVLREWKKNKIIEHQQGALLQELRNLVKECPGCHLWRDPVSDKFIAPSEFLQRYGIGVTGNICPDCMQEHYGHLSE